LLTPPITKANTSKGGSSSKDIPLPPDHVFPPTPAFAKVLSEVTAHRRYKLARCLNSGFLLHSMQPLESYRVKKGAESIVACARLCSYGLSSILIFALRAIRFIREQAVNRNNTILIQDSLSPHFCRVVLVHLKVPPETAMSLFASHTGSPTSNGSASSGGLDSSGSSEGTSTESLLLPDIAICGIGLRLPGGIRNCDEFWALLEDGRDARSPIPSNRYNVKGFDTSLGGKDGIRLQHGYFLDEDLSRLDTTFFSMTRNELEKMDPQQRLLLEVTKECLEDAGEVNYRSQPIGCYVGTFGDDWLTMNLKESQHGDAHAITGCGDLMLANRVSFEYDFRGPR
jgi:hypothetical protein